MKGIYLACCIDKHPDYDLLTNDIDPNVGADIVGDMMEIELEPFDYVIASPPCNYWSIANYRRDVSEYSLKTRHLLPDILEKLGKLDKPFLVENVRNAPLFEKFGIYEICNKYGIYVYVVGRHTYFTNVFCELSCAQEVELIANKWSKDKTRQGSKNVHNVISIWLRRIHSENYL